MDAKLAYTNVVINHCDKKRPMTKVITQSNSLPRTTTTGISQLWAMVRHRTSISTHCSFKILNHFDNILVLKVLHPGCLVYSWLLHPGIDSVAYLWPRLLGVQPAQDRFVLTDKINSRLLRAEAAVPIIMQSLLGIFGGISLIPSQS